jgi:hypothetical protein
MKRTDYQKPAMHVVKLQHSGFICQSVSSIKGGTLGGGGSDKNYSGTVRSRGFDDWDDE